VGSLLTEGIALIVGKADVVGLVVGTGTSVGCDKHWRTRKASSKREDLMPVLVLVIMFHL